MNDWKCKNAKLIVTLDAFRSLRASQQGIINIKLSRKFCISNRILQTVAKVKYCDPMRPLIHNCKTLRMAKQPLDGVCIHSILVYSDASLKQ